MKKQKYISALLCGIYFLIEDKEIVYIGKTRNLSHRLAGHANKNYDKYRFIACPDQYLDFYEKRWINKFKPKYNSIRKIDESLTLTITISVTVNKNMDKLIDEICLKSRIKKSLFVRQAVEEKIAFELS